MGPGHVKQLLFSYNNKIANTKGVLKVKRYIKWYKDKRCIKNIWTPENLRHF